MNMKKLSRFLFVSAVALFFVACNDEIDSLSVNNASPVNSLRHVSINEAKELINSLDPSFFNYSDDENTLRSSTVDERIVSSIEPIIQNSDTVMYIVNYTDNNGFVILSADKGAESVVLSFSNTGNFDKSNMNNGLDGWILNNKIEINQNKKQPLDDEERVNKVWLGVSNKEKNIRVLSIDEKEQMELRSRGIDRDEVTNNNNRGNGEPVNPDMIVLSDNLKWGQDEPFNKYCPIVSAPEDASKKRNAKVGCVAVAISMLTHHYKFPTKWDYNIMPYSRYGTTSGENERAKMLYEIALGVDMDFGYYSSGVASPSKIINLFKSWGYANSGEMRGFDPNLIKYSLQSGSPVIIWGTGISGSHLWVINGLRRGNFKRSDGDTGRINSRDLNDYEIYLNMKWGWGGNNDGWYLDKSSTTGSNPNDWFGVGGSKTYFLNIHPTKATPTGGRHPG